MLICHGVIVVKFLSLITSLTVFVGRNIDNVTTDAVYFNINVADVISVSNNNSNEDVGDNKNNN